MYACTNEARENVLFPGRKHLIKQKNVSGTQSMNTQLENILIPLLAGIPHPPYHTKNCRLLHCPRATEPPLPISPTHRPLTPHKTPYAPSNPSPDTDSHNTPPTPHTSSAPPPPPSPHPLTPAGGRTYKSYPNKHGTANVAA